MWESQAVLWSDFSKRLWESDVLCRFPTAAAFPQLVPASLCIERYSWFRNSHKWCGAKPLKIFARI